MRDETNATHKAWEELASEARHYRLTVGTSNGLFFSVKAQGDNWADVVAKVKEAKITSQSIIIVGRVLTATDFANSRLYAPDFSHGYRRAEEQ